MVFPRAFIAGKYLVETDREHILDLMEEVDLRSTVILEKQPSKYDVPEIVTSTANIISYQPTNVKIEVQGDGGFLVLSDPYYPGWRAYVNGKNAEILKANYTFRAVQIPKGKCLVEFSYRPMPFYLGIVLAWSAFMCLCGALFMKNGKFQKIPFVSYLK